MRLPIDTSRLRFLAVAAAEPLKKYEEGKPREAWGPRVDSNGEVLWGAPVVALGGGDAAVIKVSVPGDPHVTEGEMVRVEELTAQVWERDGKTGVSFRATAIESMKPRAAEKAAA